MKLSTTTAICLMFAVLAYGQPRKQSAAAPLTFSSGDMGEVETAYGAQLGFTTFAASDGVRLIVLYSRQTDEAEASRLFEQELSRAERVRSTTEFRGRDGKVGRRAVLTVQSKPLTYAVMWTSRGTLHQIRGASMRHILELEKSYDK